MATFHILSQYVWPDAAPTADLTRRIEWDSTLRFVGRLPAAPAIPRYFELDARLGWNPTPRVELR